jgi:hypothetical protein
MHRPEDSVRRLLAHSFPILLLAGCGEPRSNLDLDGGSLAQGLQVSPDASVTSASYTITSAAGVVVRTGTVAVGDSPDVQVTVNRLPVGQYELELEATASDGQIHCEGDLAFNVTQVTSITLIVHLVCEVPPGNADVQATLNVCPVLDGLSASPLSLHVGGVSSLSVEAHDSDNAPARLTVSWTVNGVLSPSPRPAAPTFAFTCSSVGPVTIVASVSDGACADSASAEVVCE